VKISLFIDTDSEMFFVQKKQIIVIQLLKKIYFFEDHMKIIIIFLNGIV